MQQYYQNPMPTNESRNRERLADLYVFAIAGKVAIAQWLSILSFQPKGHNMSPTKNIARILASFCGAQVVAGVLLIAFLAPLLGTKVQYSFADFAYFCAILGLFISIPVVLIKILDVRNIFNALMVAAANSIVFCAYVDSILPESAKANLFEYLTVSVLLFIPVFIVTYASAWGAELVIRKFDKT